MVVAGIEAAIYSDCNFRELIKARSVHSSFSFLSLKYQPRQQSNAAEREPILFPKLTPRGKQTRFGERTEFDTYSYSESVAAISIIASVERTYLRYELSYDAGSDI